MRKLLLASAAAFGATVGMVGFASAQTTNLPPTVLEGIPSKPMSVPGANNNNNYQAAMLKPGPTANPTPGSIVVRVNARVVFYTAVEGSSLDVTKGTGPGNTGAAKVGPVSTLGYVRLYFGMDGLATNGLRYGGSIEIRQNASGVGGSTSSTNSSSSTSKETLYVRRAFGYVASDKVGILRFGQADGPFGIFDNGTTTFQGFNDGAWNGDLPGAIPGNAQPTFPFLTQDGAEYGSSKLVYLSPQLAGFDFGVSYAPNNSGLNDGNCSFASSSCYNLTSSSVADDGTRYVNAYEVALRYQNTFGPVGVLAYGGYMGSGHVNYTGPAGATTYNGLGFGQYGVAIAVGGFTIGGAGLNGSVNGQGALQPQGGVSGNAWMAGIQYDTGPLTIGTSYYAYDSQGAPSLTGISQRHETGYAAGLTYGIAPGLSVYVSYLYGTRHQGDYNFQTGTTGAAYNDVKSQAFSLGTIVKW